MGSSSSKGPALSTSRYPVLNSYTGVAKGIAGGLKVTGQLNQYLRGELSVPETGPVKQQIFVTLSKIEEEIENVPRSSIPRIQRWVSLRTAPDPYVVGTLITVPNIDSWSKSSGVLDTTEMTHCLIIERPTAAKDISAINRDQAEVVFPPFTIFEVKKRRSKDGKSIVELQDVGIDLTQRTAFLQSLT